MKKTQGKQLIIVAVVLGLFLLGFVYYYQVFIEDEVVLLDGQSEQVSILVDEESGEVKDILQTDGVKHTIPLEEIVSGGPPKDGIPSIDDPQFISVDEARKDLNDEELGVGIDIDGVQRFYPFQILVWHEIVNDVVHNQRILVTYCPLCFTAFVFDPTVDGEQVEFGTSGKLWNSNLVMYDRKTDTLWSQILGEAIVGEQAGKQLSLLSSDVVAFGDWSEKFPNSEILSRETGAVRFYGRDPYGDDFVSPFKVNHSDDRLRKNDRILGLIINDEVKAYTPEAVKRAGVFIDELGGKKIEVVYDENLNVVRFYEILSENEKVRINPFVSYWFSWVAVHPDTDLYK